MTDDTPTPTPPTTEASAPTPTPETTTVPSYRLREETDKRRAVEVNLATVSAQLAELQGSYTTLTDKHTTATDTHSQDIALLSAGIKEGEVRDFIRSRYTPADGGPTFNEWLGKQRETPSPLLAPFLSATTTPTPVATPETVATPPPSGNPSAGTTSSAPTHSSNNWGADEISAVIGKSRGTLGEHKDSILAALRAEGLFK